MGEIIEFHRLADKAVDIELVVSRTTYNETKEILKIKNSTALNWH
jgi:hypothetical protein